MRMITDMFHTAVHSSRSICARGRKGPGTSPLMGNYLGIGVSAKTV
ncbi:MAG: hypothetical protein PHD67_00215 [Oscillospiraceae bacterium]|nr:hypothetical protein [Oscillospiraceae bacterium]